MPPDQDARPQTTEERILRATLKIIEQEGFQNVRVRKIASLADVNVAAINYHFGSKDQLINEALHYLSGQFMEAFIPLREVSLTPEQRLAGFLDIYFATMIRYPELVKRFVTQSMVGFSAPGQFIEFVTREGISQIKDVVGLLRPQDDDKARMMRVAQMMSSLMLPAVLGRTTEMAWGMRFDDETTRRAYVAMLVNNLIKG